MTIGAISYSHRGKAREALVTRPLQIASAISRYRQKYRLEVGPAGKGWRVAIYTPGSLIPLPESPAMLEKCSKDDLVTEAKSIIDARLNR